ncbi:NAD(P)/FAD-dependent oxidoreductase [Synechococcus sp. PCC 6312]|uniref:NAD(P)/FAD-dependent oxidoreductase n=1 Tax=Synechococcus sp. (strain ATCC 27167 / PCC 6312) TaxID=195253 RepID=UPI00029ED6C1|nr:NAD(P)/FAD-dependent oxidoreductase [Synechococcus sp. PCC 6312]AFY59507.1 NADH dehydrogenase, FAD-containing subunit [Synechococcus sp. PCC 6312]
MSETLHHVVIVGGGFAGLYAAKSLGQAPVKVTLIDKRNFHLFQPLLYQVATGSVSPANISSPLRAILNRYKNVQVLLEEVTGFDPQTQTIKTKGREIPYDSLVVATGVSHHYFGNDHWQQTAPGLKTVEDALEIRRRIFMAFEAAEKEMDPVKRQAWLTFVIVGGGPTGVELAGAIAELAFATLKQDFRNIDTRETKILLLEGLDRILPPYPADLSAKAEASLSKLGVTVKTRTLVTNITDNIVTTKHGEEVEKIAAHTILWAAGVKASGLGRVLAESTGASLDRVGRVIVEPDLSLPNYPNIYVIGDLANYAHQNGNPLPGIAPVAIQEGEYLAKLIRAKVKGEPLPTFNYDDAGSLAVIGQNEAVVNLWGWKFSGPLAWLIWVFAHIYYLIEFDHKLVVMTQWAWSYFTRNRGARLITGEDGRVNQDMEPLAAIPEQVGKA